MMNHLEPIDMAMVKALGNGEQTQITEFVELHARERRLTDSIQANRVLHALQQHYAYKNKQKGGEK